MNFSRILSLSIIAVLALAASVALAQRPGAVPKPQAAPRFRQPCDFGDPRTRLEQLDLGIEKVIVRGSTTVGSLTGRNGTVRVEAIELREEGPANRALGVAVTLRDTTRQESGSAIIETRSFMDYEEIDPLLSG